MAGDRDEAEFLDEDEGSASASQAEHFADAVLYSTDWTVGTILAQLEQGNIDVSPRFQRRDAWHISAKSRFIESVILGLPIPQIVLAEKRGSRGNFIVLDGKQRLLSLLQFSGKAEGENNRFRLKDLDVRSDLQGKTYDDLRTDAQRRPDRTAFENHTIRTVLIRNWPDRDFLHLVFLRLNTGSLKLSSQELRQAMVPGPFTDFADDKAIASTQLKVLLGKELPDPRMRDVELLVRFLAFRNFLPEYGGRMKAFLDESCDKLNRQWMPMKDELEAQVEDFEEAVKVLVKIFGSSGIARKQGSKSFNRAIFDALVFYAADKRIAKAMAKAPTTITKAFASTLKNPQFADAVESDTAGIPHTIARLEIWGKALRDATKLKFATPIYSDNKIQFIEFRK